MLAFQSPFITKLHTSRPPFLSRRHSYHLPKTTSINLVRLPVHCAFDDAPNDTSNVFDTQSYPILSQATTITVQLPLDVYLEETTDGRVFIDEIIPSGSAQVSDLLREGDVIVAVSLPFGDGLAPVPKAHAIEMIADHVATREGHTFTLAVLRTEPVEHLRTQIADDLRSSISISKLKNVTQQIHIPEYPIHPPDKDDVSVYDTNFVPDLEALREYGFDLDDILNSPDHQT